MKFISITIFALGLLFFSFNSMTKTKVKISKAKKMLKEQLNENISLLEQYKNAVDESDIVSKTDLCGRITYAHSKFSEIS